MRPKEPSLHQPSGRQRQLQLFRLHLLNLRQRPALLRIAQNLFRDCPQLPPVVPIPNSRLHFVERRYKSRFRTSSLLQNIPQLLHLDPESMQILRLEGGPVTQLIHQLQCSVNMRFVPTAADTPAHLPYVKVLFNLPQKLVQAGARVLPPFLNHLEQVARALNAPALQICEQYCHGIVASLAREAPNLRRQHIHIAHSARSFVQWLQHFQQMPSGFLVPADHHPGSRFDTPTARPQFVDILSRGAPVRPCRDLRNCRTGLPTLPISNSINLKHRSLLIPWQRMESRSYEEIPSIRKNSPIGQFAIPAKREPTRCQLLYSHRGDSLTLNGLLVIDKPAGITSHDVVNRLRKIVGEKSIGHLGTLDPMATGVLPLLLGKYTRLAQYFSSAEKSYSGTIRFGFATDTYDAEGKPAGPDLGPGAHT